MNRTQKIIDKMKRQPCGISVEEASKVLMYAGYEHKRTRGSHAQYKHPDGAMFTLVRLRPTIRSVYVDQILDILASRDLS